MKTPITKISLFGIALIVGIALSSFTFKKVNAYKKSNSMVTIKSNWDEYNKVNEFVRKNICSVIRQNESGNNGGSKLDYISRCPSGYQPQIADNVDSVKVDRIVYGKINNYKGCSRNYVCDFKVCVSKGIALVKTKEMKEYVNVKEWLAKKDKTSSVVKG
jgi:hypothetical protein